jgi:cold shock CspA family protein
MNKKIGTIVWWSRTKTCGTIIVNNSDALPERFFLHASGIISGPVELKPGDTVRFFVSSVTPKPNRLQTAVAVEVERA